MHAFPVVSSGAQFTLRTDHSSLRWLQKFRNEDGMLARWYLLLGQFSVTFEYRPGAQHANADGMSRQCGPCRRPDCLVSSSDLQVAELVTSSALLDQPFASSEMGNSMDADLLPERLYMSGYSWERSRPGLIAPDFLRNYWQSVGGYGREVMAASSCSVRSVSAGCSSP